VNDDSKPPKQISVSALLVALNWPKIQYSRKNILPVIDLHQRAFKIEEKI
jgi:hypothetical protein